MNAFQRARDVANSRLRDTITREVPHGPEKTLVIIDMQNGFMHEDEYEVVPAICSLVRHAKHQEWAIIVVEYKEYGKTDEKIRENLVGYPHWDTVYKSDCDGGPEVIKCLEDHPAWSMHLLVCGIYGPECVAQTVCGLFDESDLVEVDVVTDAIYPDYCSCTAGSENGVLRERTIQTGDIVGYTSPVAS